MKGNEYLKAMEDSENKERKPGWEDRINAL